MPQAPASSSLDYGVNNYGSAPESLSELHLLQNNYGESETVTDAYQQPSHGIHYDDQQQQQHQYHSNYYRPGTNDVQQYNNPLSYGDTTNYLNSEVNSNFIHSHLHLQFHGLQFHASILFYTYYI